MYNKQKYGIKTILVILIRFSYETSAVAVSRKYEIEKEQLPYVISPEQRHTLLEFGFFCLSFLWCCH